jgi:glutaredoxin
MKTVVWSKENCFYCHMAKGLLEREGIEYEERNIESNEWSRADMLEAVPNATTVPQIFHGDKHVGGFTELQQYLKED